MNKIASFIKATRLKQIAIAFFAGVMLLLNTACSNAAQATMPVPGERSDGGSNPVNQNQPYTGGMNNFDDTPPGQIPSDKAKSLIDNAQRNIQAKEPRNAKLYKDPGYAVERTKDTLGDAVTSRTNNAKEEVQKLGDRLNRAGDGAANKTQELGQRIQKDAGNVADNINNSVVGAAEDTKYKAKQAGKTLKDAVNDAID